MMECPVTIDGLMKSSHGTLDSMSGIFCYHGWYSLFPLIYLNIKDGNRTSALAVYVFTMTG